MSPRTCCHAEKKQMLSTRKTRAFIGRGCRYVLFFDHLSPLFTRCLLVFFLFACFEIKLIDFWDCFQAVCSSSGLATRTHTAGGQPTADGLASVLMTDNLSFLWTEICVSFMPALNPPPPPPFFFFVRVHVEIFFGTGVSATCVRAQCQRFKWFLAAATH